MLIFVHNNMVFMYICTKIPDYILEPPVPIYMTGFMIGSMTTLDFFRPQN